jgi:putative DNA primase/helicase
MTKTKKSVKQETIAAIPAALRQCPQWVCWRAVRKPDGRIAKVPCQPDGTAASVTDRNTWSDFQTCLASGRSVGFVLTAEAGFVAIDLDHVRSRTGVIDPWAADIIKEFKTYAEVSPSGAGLHIWLRGTLPPEGRRKNRLEVYDDKRYMTVTGDHLNGAPTDICDRQAVLTAWHGQVFEKAPAAPADPKSTGVVVGNLPAREDEALVKLLRRPPHEAWVWFDALYTDGDLQYHGEDFSRGLYCLALILARETRDAAQIERIIRASKVFLVAETARKKWQAPRGNTTWGANLIADAMHRAAQHP